MIGVKENPREGDLEKIPRSKNKAVTSNRTKERWRPPPDPSPKTDPTAEREREADGWKLNGPNLPTAPRRAPIQKVCLRSGARVG